MGNNKLCKNNNHFSHQPGIATTSTDTIMHSTQAPTTQQFHIPAGILAKIVSYRGSRGGPASLKNWILAGPEGKSAVYSKETLSRVTFGGHPLFMMWSKPEPPYFTFFSKCLEHKNPQALYIESIRLGFCSGDLDGAIKISRKIKDCFPTASLLHIMLCSFSGEFDDGAFKKFKREHKVLEEVQDIGECLIFHFNLMNPRRQDSYAQTWGYQLIPECFLDHDWFQEDNGGTLFAMYLLLYIN